MANLVRLFILASIIWISLASAQAPDPRSSYREIYNLITLAEQTAAAGDAQNASTKYKEILLRLNQFQKQFPDWEPDIVKFRVQYAEDQLQMLEAKAPAAPPAPVVPAQTTPAPASVPSYAPQAPPPPPSPQQLPPLSAPPSYPAYAAVAPPPPTYQPSSYQRQPTYPPLPPGGAPAYAPPTVPTAPPLPPAPPLSSYQPLPPAPQPSTESKIPVAAVRSEGIQDLARQVESEMSRLMEENRALRTALAEAESRANVSANYLKTLTRENEILKAQLDQEIRKRQALHAVLTEEIAEHNDRWNQLRGKIKELLQDSPPIGVPVSPQVSESKLGDASATREETSATMPDSTSHPRESMGPFLPSEKGVADKRP